MLSDIPAPTDDRVLVDFRTADDAGVYRWEAGPALVQTVDFFTPIVDDPYTYGQIAAANAISDIYAMGGTPLTALAIAGFPKDEVDRETIQAIFRGGFATLREAGVSLLGGHTVQDREIKFGYAVTGAIDPARILTNAGAQPGDILFLTKPIGTGIVGTAIKFDRAPASLVDEAVASMRTLNRAACEAMRAFVLEAEQIPAFHGVFDLLATNQSGGLTSNLEHFGSRVQLTHEALESSRIDSPFALRVLLHDPQTSGGLLIAANGDSAELVERAIRRVAPQSRRVGGVEARIHGVDVLIK